VYNILDIKLAILGEFGGTLRNETIPSQARGGTDTLEGVETRR
jgi:hypothetical protein